MHQPTLLAVVLAANSHFILGANAAGIAQATLVPAAGALLAAPVATPPPSRPQIDRRDDSYDSCVSSLISKHQQPLATGVVKDDILSFASAHPYAGPCVISFPQSHSDDVLSLMSQIQSYYNGLSTVTPIPSEHCNGPPVLVTVDQGQCATTTCVFTDSDEDDVTSTFPLPTNTPATITLSGAPSVKIGSGALVISVLVSIMMVVM